MVLQWEEGSYHGVGVERFAQGSAYHGSYVRGVRQGYGVCHYYNKDYFEGQWAGGLRNGRGGHSPLAEGSPACRCLGPLLEHQLLAHQTLEHLVALFHGSGQQHLLLGAPPRAPAPPPCRHTGLPQFMLAAEQATWPSVTSLFPMWTSPTVLALTASCSCCTGSQQGSEVASNALQACSSAATTATTSVSAAAPALSLCSSCARCALTLNS